MALRISKPTLTEQSPQADANSRLPQTDPDAFTVERLAKRAGTALAAADYPAYRELFAEAALLQNEHRRYQARKLLAEQAIAGVQNADRQQVTETFVSAATELITVLEQTPAEPVLLNYAGVLLYELWSLEAAAALFAAAQRLAPEVPHLEGNIRGARSRLREHRKPVVLHPEIRGLAKRAVAAAQRAVPATGQRISLCMIVKDEEEMLPRSLAAVAPAVDEIIVVDTGSTDRSIEIARSFGATVIQRPWTGSFSDARNASLDAATGDWFLCLDADEVLVSEDAQKLRELAGCTWHEASFLLERNFTGEQETGLALQHSALRLIRNRPEYRFSGRLHEQIAQHLPAYLPERIRQSNVRVDHYGYLGAVRDAKEKSKRNIELLLAQQREAPADAFFHYNLGSEYFAAGDKRAALNQFRQSWAMAEANGSTRFEFVPSLVVRLVITMRHLGQVDEMLEMADLGLLRFPGFTDLVYEKGVAYAQIGSLAQATEQFELAIEMGDAPSRYTAIVGAGTFLPRIALGTMQLSVGDTRAALEHLQWCLDNTPEYFGVVHPYATAMLKSGYSADQTVAAVQGALPLLSATYRFMLGVALYEREHPAHAEEQFRQVLAKQPGSGAARAALVESLLYQRRYQEAAQEAALVGVEDPVKAIALRSELFAHLLEHDTEAAARAMDQARELGLPTAEIDLFDAWLGLLNTDLTTPLGSSATAMLELVLEALLRVRDFENFETVLRVWLSLEISDRDRRERMAQIYLRRGFLRSAAREWMAVCEEEPDAAALAGLSRVALLNGQTQPALTFATQALSREPDNPMATEVLRACTQLATAA